jgi:hypothetical protein
MDKHSKPCGAHEFDEKIWHILIVPYDRLNLFMNNFEYRLFSICIELPKYVMP